MTGRLSESLTTPCKVAVASESDCEPTGAAGIDCPRTGGGRKIAVTAREHAAIVRKRPIRQVLSGKAKQKLAYA
jgi:hypothetical protein